MFSEPTPFSIRQSRATLQDLFHHKAAIYWADFLISLAVAYTAAVIYLYSTWFTATQAVTYVITIFALFRLGSFIHEIVHMPVGVMRRFRIVWNLLVGVPTLAPSFFYGNHIDHHKTHHYGTGNDGEYLPLAYGKLRHVAFFLAQNLYIPAAIFLRFAILTPLSFLHPKLRDWTLRRASSFIMNFRYQREIAESLPRKWWAFMEILCCLRANAILATVFLGLAPWSQIPALYLLAVGSLSLNYIRNLVAHRYRSTGESMSHFDQLNDSINITGHWFWTELLFPVGLRYHALHHLFPTLPYHNLGVAHRRLIAHWPTDSAYHHSTYASFRSAYRDLREDMRLAIDDDHAMFKQWYQRRKELVVGRTRRAQDEQHSQDTDDVEQVHTNVREY